MTGRGNRNFESILGIRLLMDISHVVVFRHFSQVSIMVAIYLVFTLHPLFRAFLRLRTDAEVKDPVAVRKIQKADREKLRRDRLNEHFLELGNTLGKVHDFYEFSLPPYLSC